MVSGDGQNTDSGGFELFDSDNGHDLTLSPQTFTANTTADSFLVNDNSNSIGMPVNESDTGKIISYVYIRMYQCFTKILTVKKIKHSHKYNFLNN